MSDKLAEYHRQQRQLAESLTEYDVGMIGRRIGSQTQAKVQALRAENERLKQGSDTMQPLEYIAFLRAENDRLRATLDEIAALGNGPLGEIAREALRNI